VTVRRILRSPTRSQATKPAIAGTGGGPNRATDGTPTRVIRVEGEHTSAGTLVGDQKQRPRSDRYYADTDRINNSVIIIVNTVPITS
jgi:hypothetical protein